MTSSTAKGLSRVLLVADKADRPAGAPDARIRRYRLARLQLDAQRRRPA
ncbi:MAG TPA: hypothetical protein VD931_06075 [Baekduia sp.]|nr:hypothetical protein [Baekduia sp.]